MNATTTAFKSCRYAALLLLVVGVTVVWLPMPGVPAQAAACSHSGSSRDNYLFIKIKCQKQPQRTIRSSSRSTGTRSAGQTSSSGSSSGIYVPEPVCVSFSTATTCGGTSRCQLQQSVITGFWAADLSNSCAVAGSPTRAAAVAAAAPPQVTPGLVQSAFRTIGLPSLTALTQPEDKTLVNFPTIFYTRPADFTRTIALLGQPVTVHASPVGFTWQHGDGTSQTTSGPGAPYPAKDVTHEYIDAHVTVGARVDVTYAGRFRVGGGPWQAIPGTVTISGPDTPLRVSEATPVLSGDHR